MPAPLQNAYSRIQTALSAIGKLDGDRYHLGQQRYAAVRSASDALARLFDNAPDGLMQLTPAALVDAEASYLVIELADARYDGRHYGRVTLIRVGIRHFGEPFAIDLTTNEVLGKLNRMALTPSCQWSASGISSHGPQRAGAYLDLNFGCPDRSLLGRTKFAFPMSGPSLEHPVFKRQAEYALDILHNQSMSIQIVRKLDRKLAESDAARAAQQKIVADIVAAAGASLDPASVDGELVTLIRRMDWTFEEADRPDRQYHDLRRAISAKLNALPVDTAIAFIGGAGAYWSYAFRLIGKPAQRLAA